MPSEELMTIAFFLPQFHPTPENDAWWGPGFTEWVNVAMARPLFAGHHQPHIPGELGFYDLRLAETRAAQAELARAHGVDAFCYYHYWFNGRQVLDRPLTEVLRTREPDMPFLLCWANENWTRAWDGADREVLLAQTYSADDDLAHIHWLREVFADHRYVRVEGRPLMLVYRARQLPDPAKLVATWRGECERASEAPPYMVAVESFPDEVGDPRLIGFDAAVEFAPEWWTLVLPPRRTDRLLAAALRRGYMPVRFSHRIVEYRHMVDQMRQKAPVSYPRFRTATPGWDNSPRRRMGGLILKGSNPELYGKWVEELALETLSRSSPRLLFVNAWNEWAEGAHLEPDRLFGRAYLEAHHDALRRATRSTALQDRPVVAERGELGAFGA